MSEKKEVLVSVIIPIYNVEKYIQKCIESVLNQTWKNLEIICVNDGTRDNSMDVIQEKAVTDNRIVIVNIENSGLSVARNVGMKNATGKYIYFLDSDDYLAEDAIEQLVNCAEENQLDVLFFNTETIFETEEIAQKQRGYATYYNRKGTYTGVFKGEDLFISMLQNGDFKPSACLIFTNRYFVEKLGLQFYPGILHEDNLYTLQLIQSAARVSFLDLPLYKRLVREASITSGEKNVRHAYGFYVCQRELLTFLSKRQFSLGFFVALKKYLDIMKKNAVNALKEMELEYIRAEIDKLDPEATASFLEYIYDMYKVQRNVNVQQKTPIGNKGKRIAKKAVNKFNRLKNRIIRMIPGSVRWYIRIIKRFGFGYFLYRKNLKKNADKVCVSIIIPVYNVKKYLAQTLDSLLNQSLRNIEIICVDDGSTDGSKSILQEYQNKDSRIKVLYQENTGAGAARNYGMSIAKGEYLLFLDADDFFQADLCNEVYYQCIRKKADVCLYGAQRLNMQTFETEPMNWVLRSKEIPKKNLFSGKDINERLFQITSGCPWSKMFRREFVLQNGLQFQNLPNTNDAFFVRMSLALAERITTVDRYFVTYRYNEGNNTQSNKAKAPLAFYEAFKAMKLEMQQRGVYEQFERAYCNMVLTESLFNLRTAGTEEAKEKVRHLLRTEAIEFYGLESHPEKYYYNKKEYHEMQELLK